MQSGKKHGMQTMNDALYQLYLNREVTLEEAVRCSSDPSGLMRMAGEVPLEDQDITGIDDRRMAKSYR